MAEMQAKYRTDMEVASAQVRTYADAIAEILGPGWQVRPSKRDADDYPLPYATVEHCTGAAFQIGQITYPPADRDKWQISGEAPTDATGRSEWPRSGDGEIPRIKISKAKDPQTAAKEITRRFLASYLPLYAILRARVDSANQYRSDRASLAATVAGIVGGEVPTRQYDRERLAEVRVTSGNRLGIASVELGSGDKVAVTIGVDVDTLRALVAFLEGRQA